MALHKRGRTRILTVACLLLCAASVYFVSGSGPAPALAAEELDTRAYRYETSARAHVTVHYGSQSYEYYDAILPAPDHTVYEQLERRNINAPLEVKMATVDKCLSAGAKWREAMRYSFPLLPGFVDEVCAAVNYDAVDSKIKFRPERSPMFTISRAKNGVEADEKRLFQDIYLALRKGAQADVRLYVKTLTPAVTIEDNVKLTRKISAYSTSYASSADGRKNNIRLALGKVSGTVVQPGEEFSFNGTVGPRTEKAGYETAKIIVGGEYVEGIGGGVCQASTTLYNAALLAGMEIREVHNHTIAPSYVPPSLDAMVNSSSADLRFVNPYPTPVFIKAVCGAENVTVTFYGAETEYTVRAYSRVLSRTDPPADKEITDYERKFVDELSPQGTRVRVSYGHEGITSEAFLRYFDSSGRQVREEKIRTDVYNRTQGVIAVAP